MIERRGGLRLGHWCLPLTVFAIAGCNGVPEAAPAHARPQGQGTVTSVTVVKPERATIRKTTRQPGQIEAFEGTSLHAKIAGYVKSLAVDIGDPVRAGQVLAELDDPELLAELKQKRALVKQAEAQHAQAVSSVEVARSSIASAEAKVTEALAAIRRTAADTARWQAEYDRTSELVRDRAVTGAVLDETRSKLAASRAAGEEADAKVRTAQATLAQANAGLAQAQADVVAAEAHIQVAQADADRVQALVAYTHIVAPFDGVVTKRHVHTGHLTVPGGTGDPLFTIERLDRVRVVVGVPEADAGLVNEGDKAQVRLQALNGRVIEGQVDRIAWSLDQSTRTLRAEIDLLNPKGELRPGLYAYATIVSDEKKDVLLLPLTAIAREGDKSYCVVVQQDKAVRRSVETGLNDGQKIEIRSGLSESDTVVVANATSLQDGQAVRVQSPVPIGRSSQPSQSANLNQPALPSGVP